MALGSWLGCVVPQLRPLSHGSSLCDPPHCPVAAHPGHQLRLNGGPRPVPRGVPGDWEIEGVVSMQLRPWVSAGARLCPAGSLVPSPPPLPASGHCPRRTGSTHPAPAGSCKGLCRLPPSRDRAARVSPHKLAHVTPDTCWPWGCAAQDTRGAVGTGLVPLALSGPPSSRPSHRSPGGGAAQGLIGGRPGPTWQRAWRPGKSDDELAHVFCHTF